MRIAIASDIHGSLTDLEVFLNRKEVRSADKILLLGDLYYHGIRNNLPDGYQPLKVAELLNTYVDKLLVVKGNCDSDVDAMVSNFEFLPELMMFVGGKTVYCTHGDKHNIDNLPKGQYDLLLYGHYHTGFIKKREGKMIANPGSISLPKGGTEKSFLILTEDTIGLYNLEGTLLEQMSL